VNERMELNIQDMDDWPCDMGHKTQGAVYNSWVSSRMTQGTEGRRNEAE